MTATDRAAVFCRNCGAEASVGDRFCGKCGKPHGAVAGGGNHISTGGGDLKAKHITQIADSVIHVPVSSEPAAPDLDVTWSWKSPLTQAVLGWISLTVGLIGLFAAYQSLQPALGLASGRHPAELDASTLGVWAYVFMGAAAVFVISRMLRRMAKHQTMAVGWSWLPALTGWGKRIGLATLTGRCTGCGANLRFASRPTKWLIDAAGNRGKTIERDMFAECVADPEHHNWRLERRLVGHEAGVA
ncbi:zinc ribbon domain-containing protein [Agromyces sp. ISL-38]|uniref:zinc ribbon domain-containing protein n=1 Tax=Agromyces sp. ISL-38 TaxID=2819107 RepID=UPI001BE5C828|nr:zinc ribbon domain-containing protein [Agromyces sp. ISL-38]MBT2500098.1 zinc ribbon domain-containing protein [Agromyces sp. ISL-38]